VADAGHDPGPYSLSWSILFTRRPGAAVGVRRPPQPADHSSGEQWKRQKPHTQYQKHHRQTPVDDRDGDHRGTGICLDWALRLPAQVHEITAVRPSEALSDANATYPNADHLDT
jgi:hypothetical protein